jgi:anoctamin-10
MVRQYFQDVQDLEEVEKPAGGVITEGQISRSTLENEARESTLRGHGTPEERFWRRQQGQAETIAVGKSYISKVCTYSRF